MILKLDIILASFAEIIKLMSDATCWCHELRSGLRLGTERRPVICSVSISVDISYLYHTVSLAQ